MMNTDSHSPSEIREVLRMKNVAVVGMSNTEDNLTVHNAEDISLAIQTKKMGDSLTLTVLRSGQTKQVPVTPTPKPDYLLFKDPGLSYTILYPSNWTAVQPEILQELAQQSERLRELTRPETVQQVAASFVRPDSPRTSISITMFPSESRCNNGIAQHQERWNLADMMSLLEQFRT